jgi:CSLREA domain-containing protein
MSFIFRGKVRRGLPRHLFRSFLAAMGAAALTLAAGSARAVTFTVNTSSDTHDNTPGNGFCRDASGKCSLRAAIEENNASFANAIINIGARTINLNTASGYGQLNVTAAATINGAGSGSTIIDARGNSRVMRVAVISLLLSDVTLVNGNGCVDVGFCDVVRTGGEIYVEPSGWLTVRRSVFTTNASTGAPHILPFPGGGVSVAGALDMTDCTVSGNSTPHDTAGGTQDTGGGLFVYLGGSAQVYYSTFSGNVAQRGGGIATGGGSLKLVNSTVSGNSSTFEGGGGVYIGGTGGSSAPGAIADIMYSTITNNQISAPTPTGSGYQIRWGAGIRVNGGVLNLGKSIVAYNDDHRMSTDVDYSPDIGQDSAAQIVSYDDNLIGAPGNHLGNYVGADGNPWDWFGSGWAGLDPLAFNGGYTQTHYLWGGDAIDSYTGDGGNARFASPGDDQTHWGRPLDGNGDGAAYSDSGSFEY